MVRAEHFESEQLYWTLNNEKTDVLTEIWGILKSIQLTVQGAFTHVRTLVSALMGSPFPKFIRCVLDYRGT